MLGDKTMMDPLLLSEATHSIQTERDGRQPGKECEGI
jgi:hypothetical protein